MTWSDWRSLYRSQGSRAAMLVPSCVWRSALLRHRALQHVLHGCRGVTSRLLYVAAIRQSPPGAEQSNVRLLYTSQALRQIRKPTNPVPRSPEAPPQTTVQKVTQAGMDITFFFVVVAGAIVTAGLIYFVIQELFSSSSPSRIYGKALVKCQNHPEVIGAFGEPIKGHGEPTTRGRRQHVISTEYLKDGAKCMRLKFYISGAEQKKEGTVYVDVKQDAQSGKYEFQYIIVEIVDSYPRRTIVVEDNRY